MIADHRPDTVTPLLKQITSFEAAAPMLLAATQAADPRLGLLIRQALRSLRHYDLPIGVKDTSTVSPSWIAAFHYKLESPNVFMRDWRIRSHLRKKWNTHLWKMITRTEGVAAHEGLVELGRAPNCQVAMAIQVARLVPSSREFLRDSDNTAFCVKSLGDALKDVKLIREDRREWFTPAPIIQDVSPIGVPVTVFILRPASPGLTF